MPLFRTKETFANPVRALAPLLLAAAERGDAAQVAALVAQGAPLDTGNECGTTPLMWAAVNGHAEVVKILLDGGANPNMTSEGQNTALMWAAQRGHLDAACLLIGSGAAIDCCNKRGETALITAIGYERAEMVRLLLEKGADPRCAPAGTTPLEKAESRGFTDIAKLLEDAVREKERAATPAAPKKPGPRPLVLKL